MPSPLQDFDQVCYTSTHLVFTLAVALPAMLVLVVGFPTLQVKAQQ
jgi:hypothetical protein